MKDEHRAESYKKVKKIIDRYHQQFIDNVLDNIALEGLNEYQEYYCIKNRNEQQEKQFENIKKKIRKQISDAFTGNPKFKCIFSKDMIENELLEYTKDNTDEQELIYEFDKFTTYFQGFYDNRKNMYSCDGKSTEVAYRIVDQNLPKYIDNISIYKTALSAGLDKQISDAINKIKTYYNIPLSEQLFDVNGFNNVLSQKGISIYNYIIGGFSDKERSKIQGINEIINIYNQHVDKKDGKKIPKCKQLFKQILSDREDAPFIIEQFESDEEVFSAIDNFYCEMNVSIFNNVDSINVQQLLSGINNYNLSGIFIKNGLAITDISKNLFSDWSIINHALEMNYDKNNNTKNKQTEAYIEKRKKVIKKQKAYSIEFLNNVVTEYTDKEVHIEKYYVDKFNNEDNLVNKIIEQKRHYDELLATSRKKPLRKNDVLIENIKQLLDLFNELQRLIQPLINYDESAKDPLFYSEIERIWNILDLLTPLYNKVRNYITKKPYSIEKSKINFNSPTLLKGWDKNKEETNLAIIFEKNGLFYLGVIDKNNNKVITKAPKAKSNNVYKKMIYKQIPNPSRDFPHVFLAKGNIDYYKPDNELLKKYEQKTHLKNNPNFCLEDCHKLIDFFKQSIKKNEDWAKFNFVFSDTKTYKDLSDFYREVDAQRYKITFENIDEDYINQLVSEGKLYLFQIYNKDFSEYSKGKPNLHTLYWKMLFAPENLENVVYKLNGEAEIFYRRASIKQDEIIKHPANEPINNKNELNKKAKSVFEYDLIKDKRYTIDKYQFHVPITMNFGAQGDNHFNLSVNKAIKYADDVNVIGIDRGERNLLYLVVINSKGEIIKQKSLNEIITVNNNKTEFHTDYHILLDKREKENVSARQNWKTINTIKELKEGYLSQVIHVITEWMLEYNAIVVLEDLNFGFKRGRQKFEKQVYQKFEKMLIDKLNYIVDKNKDIYESAGLLNALQLTNKFETFKTLGKQSGFLYYVPAWLTSKIDSTTGFANLFNNNDIRYSSVEASKEFFSKFISITYNPLGIHGSDYFEFSFDYNDFTYRAADTQTHWTVCSYGERIHHFRNQEKNNEWDTQYVDLTKSMKNLFDNYNINYQNVDIKEDILKISEKAFFKELLWLFSLILQMRNSDSDNNVDRLISPVLNDKNEFFDTGLKIEEYPIDADANGAYNIARKGLWVINQIKLCDDDKLNKLKLAMSNKEWLQFAQENRL